MREDWWKLTERVRKLHGGRCPSTHELDARREPREILARGFLTATLRQGAALHFRCRPLMAVATSSSAKHWCLGVTGLARIKAFSENFNDERQATG
jgi:hypothetical protein